MTEAVHGRGEAMAEKLQGGCFCRKIRYALTKAPMFVQCCHCTDCQRQAGTAFVVNAQIETEAIVATGEAPVPVRMPTDSGRPHDVYRCVSCQTPLWSDYGGRPALRFLRVGTLDKPALLPPQAHIFTRSKLPWVELPAEMSYEIYYDMAALWPPESLARRTALGL